MQQRLLVVQQADLVAAKGCLEIALRGEDHRKTTSGGAVGDRFSHAPGHDRVAVTDEIEERFVVMPRRRIPIGRRLVGSPPERTVGLSAFIQLNHQKLPHMAEVAGNRSSIRRGKGNSLDPHCSPSSKWPRPGHQPVSATEALEKHVGRFAVCGAAFAEESTLGEGVEPDQGRNGK